MRNDTTVHVRCRFTRGGFAHERVFWIATPDRSGWYRGLAYIDYCFSPDRTPLPGGEMLPGSSVDGFVTARVIGLAGNRVTVQVPDGELCDVDASLVGGPWGAPDRTLRGTEPVAGVEVSRRHEAEGSDMAILRCEVTDGPRAGFAAVGVASVEGFTEYLTIEDRFLVVRGTDRLLPVWLVGWDPRHKTALVQLPVEADSGANRVWVWWADLIDAPDEVST